MNAQLQSKGKRTLVKYEDGQAKIRDLESSAAREMIIKRSDIALLLEEVERYRKYLTFLVLCFVTKYKR